MRFITHKRRHTPAVIIVSLIDILIVVLIFLIATTAFKQQPAIKLALPESKQARTGSSESALVVTVARQEPYLYLGTRPVTLDSLQSELAAEVRKNPQLTLAIRADTDAPFGQIIKVMDAAKSANIQDRNVSAFTQKNAAPGR